MTKPLYLVLFLVATVQICLSQDIEDAIYRAILADNDVEVIKALSEGLDPNSMIATRNAVHTLLTLCAEANAPKVTLVLIHAGADLELENSKFWRPLQVSSEFGTFEVSKVLVENGADINSFERVGKNTALHVSSFFMYPDIQKLLIDAGADIEARDHNGETPLHKAAYNGDPLCVDNLLQKGSNPNAQRVDLKTPLHYAAMEGRAGPTDSILKHGGDFFAKDTQGNTPLDLAEKRGQTSTIEVLKNYAALNNYN